MKVVRLDLGPALQFMLRQEPSITDNVKVIHLVRDPRAIWTSRRRLGWCAKTTNCSSAAVLCADMERDLDAYDSFSRHSPAGVAYQVSPQLLESTPSNKLEYKLKARLV